MTLSPPPASLTDAARAFYDELLQMLDVVGPQRLDAARSTVEFGKDTVRVNLEHEERSDWSVWADVGSSEAVVGVLGAHEHFEPWKDDERPWTTQAVDFIAEILRGEVEVETTFRGESALAVRHFNLGPDGERQLVVYTAFLTPARLALWRRKRTVTERVSFV